MSAFRLVLAVSIALPSAGLAQVQVDDRPEVLERKPLTREELQRQEAQEQLRHARTLFGIGVVRLRHEKLLEALSTLEKAASLDPDSLEIRRALLPLYLAVGREETAIDLCRDILDAEPHDTETGYQLAKLLKADGRSAEAVRVLRRAVGLKEAQDRPERLLFMLSDLYELLDRQGDHAGAADAQDAIIRTITEKREHLLFGNGFSRIDLQDTLARAQERLGRARIQTREFDKAATAFRAARETLMKSEDPAARHQAVRLSWNLSEVAAAQERWAEALDALDNYLEHSPAEVEPYERKVEWLRKLGRDREVLPALRRYAAREEYHLGLQLLFARELARDPRTRREAEDLYLALLARNIKPDIYRGLFHLYRDEDRMEKVLDLLDESFTRADAKPEDVRADEREAAQERARAMLSVLRTDPPLVAALLPEALAELGRARKRSINTWSVLASLAARTRQLDRAERFFQQCLINLPAEHESKVYSGLIQVLFLQKKYAEVATLCRGALDGRRPNRNTHAVLFESSLASALEGLGRYEEALTHADKAIRLASEDSAVRQRCLKAEILAHAGRHEDAIRECEATLKEFPEMSRVRTVRYTLSNIYSQKGDHACSEEQLRLILETDPDAALANNNLGYQMADRNVNLNEAERFIRRAIEVDRSTRKEAGEEGDNAAYLDSLGWVLFRQGKYTEAREWLEQAVALPDGADDPTVWDHLGDTYTRLDLPEKAKEAWQKSLKLYEAETRRKVDGKRSEVARKLRTVE